MAHEELKRWEDYLKILNSFDKDMLTDWQKKDIEYTKNKINELRDKEKIYDKLHKVD